MSEPIRVVITAPGSVATETLSLITMDGEAWYDRRDTVEALHRLLVEARAQLATAHAESFAAGLAVGYCDGHADGFCADGTGSPAPTDEDVRAYAERVAAIRAIQRERDEG